MLAKREANWYFFQNTNFEMERNVEVFAFFKRGFMKNIFFVIAVLVLSSCNKFGHSKAKTEHETKFKTVKLFCGQIKYGCEDVNTDTLSIEFQSKDKIKIIRQYHGSDLPFTSAFIGKFINAKEISASYNKNLTETNWRQVQDKFPQGDIVLTLSCSNLSIYQGCTVSGKALNESLVKYPGWEKGYSIPENLPCNLKKITTTEASEKDCQSE